MRLVTIDTAGGGQCGALLSSGEILHLARVAQGGTLEAWVPTTMRALLAAGESGLDVVRAMIARVEAADASQRSRWARRGAILPADTPLLAPVPDPIMIVAIGQAYHAHVREMNGKPPAEPLGFIKASGSIAAPGSDIVLPRQHPDHVDFEGEFCVVIGRTCHDVAEEDAMRYVAGYTVANDVSARDWTPLVQQARTTGEARAAWDLNHMGKQFPGFAPFGPALVTADEIADPGALELTTRVNGQVMQRANTSDLIFPIAQAVAYFSRWYTLQPGDIISTGTPGGVGFGRDPKVLLRDGDVVEVEVERVGVLRNRFVAAG